MYESGRAGGVPAEIGQPLLPPDLPGALWRRKWLLIGFVAVASALGGIYAILARANYQIVARVLVERQGVSVDQNRAEVGRDELFIASQAEVVRSPAVVRGAVKALAIPPPPEGQPDPAVTIQAALQVKPVIGTTVLSVTYTDPNPDRPVKLMQALIDAYRDYLHVSDQDSELAVLGVLTRNEKDLRRELDALQRRYEELRKQGPLMGQARDVADVQRSTLTHLGQTLADAKSRRLELENRIQTLAQIQLSPQVAALLTPAAAIEAARTATTENRPERTEPTANMRSFLPAETDIQQELHRARAREQLLGETYGPRHPDVRAARNGVVLWQNALREHQEAGQAALRQELAMLQAQEKRLADLYQEEHKKAKEIDAFVLKEQDMQAEIRRIQGIYDTTLAQLKQWQLIDKSIAAGRSGVLVRILEMPAAATPVVFPPPILVLPACALLGLMGGVGLAFLLERTTTKVQSPEQAQSALELPVLGRIPAMAAPRGSRSKDLYRSRLTCRAPASPAAEAFRALRTRLAIQENGRGGLILQLASPGSQDGKTTVLVNLACSFAQLGKRVVAVDGDLRGGTLHEAFDVAGAPGLGSVLEGGASLEDAIHRSPLAAVDVLPRGPEVGSPVESLAQPQLDEILADLRGQYDIILVDTPPLLTGTEASVLAPKVDGVVLSLRVGHSSTVAAARACELLESLGTKPLGMVVNEVEPEREVANRYAPRPVEGLRNGASKTAAVS